MPGPIPPLSQADLSNAAAMQRVAAVANEGHLFSVSEQMEAHATPGGRAILHFPWNRITDRRMVALASSTYTDSRYRLLVTAILPANATGGVGGNPPTVDDPLELAQETRSDLYPEGGSSNITPSAKSADVGSFITGHNLAEMIYYADSGNNLISGTHLLVDKVGSSPAQLFEAWCIYDDEANPQPHWFFCLPPPEVIYVGLTVHGGTAGAVPPNWTYDLIYRGVTIATNQTPIAPARLSISVEAANSGIAVIEPVGRASYILYYANEAPDTKACTS